MPKKYLFSSESVSEGHPDKICDQISDAILDFCLSQDSESRVACETFVTTQYVLVAGEISTKANLNKNKVEEIVRNVVSEIGYNDEALGFDAKNLKIEYKIDKQSSDISMGVTAGEGLYKEQGAGDQGMMFGFACNETEELMPATLVYANRILERAAKLRKTGKYPWMRPDAKSLVTIEYEDFKPKRISTIVVSHQHSEEKTLEEIREFIIKKVVEPALKDTGLLTEETQFFVNPTGRFVVGGPCGDSGLTGRKLIVDTYGGMGRHGGGCFSGKDATKVDRCAAYMARYVAKNIVAAELADRCELEIAYAIGVAKPVSVFVETFGTGKVSEKKLAEAVASIFDLTPAGIAKKLDLKKPKFLKTATYGHFGRKGFSWEKTDKVQDLKNFFEKKN